MLVVIEIEDWTEDNEGLLRELTMLQESQDRIIHDPLFDPDEPDEALVIKTEEISIGAARIVGIIDEGESPDYDDIRDFRLIKPLEA